MPLCAASTSEFLFHVILIRRIKRNNCTISKDIKSLQKKTSPILTLSVTLFFLNFVGLINAQWTNIEEKQLKRRPSFYSPVLRVIFYYCYNYCL